MKSSQLLQSRCTFLEESLFLIWGAVLMDALADINAAPELSFLATSSVSRRAFWGRAQPLTPAIWLGILGLVRTYHRTNLGFDFSHL